MKNVALLVPALLLTTACSMFKPTSTVNGKGVPESTWTKGQWLQTDPNRIANLEIRDNLAAMYLLMSKLYKRNPVQWKKTGAVSMDEAMARVREAVESRQPLPGLEGKRSVEAMRLALATDFEGDRVGALIYGMADMLLTAHGSRDTLYIIHGYDAQSVYNAARNIEIVMWLLAEREDGHGHPLLLSNALSGHERNLSFERLFGAMIGRTDLVAEFGAEKYRRSVINFVQSFASARPRRRISTSRDPPRIAADCAEFGSMRASDSAPTISESAERASVSALAVPFAAMASARLSVSRFTPLANCLRDTAESRGRSDDKAAIGQPLPRASRCAGER